ncbi:hypothetical protein KR093_010760, partial [Drosophila rubida]
ERNRVSVGSCYICSFSKFVLDLKAKVRALGNCSQLTLVQIALLLAFFKDSVNVINRCSKPDRREFQRTAMATTVGFLIMGFLGYIIKLLHTPITNIIMG